MTAAAPSATLRECRRCGAIRSESEFPPNRRICRECKREYNREYRAANRDRLNASNARYWRENKGRLSEYHRSYRSTNAAAISTRSREYRERNADELRAYRQTRRDERREAQRRWRQAHPEDHRAISRRWTEQNPEKARALRLRRDERVAAAGWTNVTADGVRSRVEYYGGLCWICRSAPYEHLDHVKPLAAGGPHILANIRPACAACNSSKRDRWPFPTGVQ